MTDSWIFLPLTPAKTGFGGHPHGKTTFPAVFSTPDVAPYRVFQKPQPGIPHTVRAQSKPRRKSIGDLWPQNNEPLFLKGNHGPRSRAHILWSPRDVLLLELFISLTLFPTRRRNFLRVT